MNGSTGTGAWQRLGALLIQRRTALSPRYHNRGAFCEATGLKYRLVYDIEEARRTNFGTSTLAAIEAAYRLAPGTIARFLAGGELEPQGGSAPLASAASTLPAPSRRSSLFAALPREMRAQVEPLYSQITGRAEAAADAHRGVPLEGRWVYPRDPVEARRWDVIAARGRAIYPEGFTIEEAAEAQALAQWLDSQQQEPGDVAAGLARADVAIRPWHVLSRRKALLRPCLAHLVRGGMSRGQGEPSEVRG